MDVEEEDCLQFEFERALILEARIAQSRDSHVHARTHPEELGSPWRGKSPQINVVKANHC